MTPHGDASGFHSPKVRAATVAASARARSINRGGGGDLPKARGGFLQSNSRNQLFNSFFGRQSRLVILACHEAGITVTLPKPMTSGAKSDGRFGKQDFVYLADEDVYRCPAGERLTYRYTNEEDGKVLRRYWTTACPECPLKSQCTEGPERRITRWEHEHVLEAVQQRLDANPEAMRQRRETVEHPFGTIKARMGATHFLMKTLPKVASEMALSVLAI